MNADPFAYRLGGILKLIREAAGKAPRPPHQAWCILPPFAHRLYLEFNHL
jgi:hypothetical protein